MSFITDKQTLEDLNIPGKYKNNSIFKLFNQVRTSGGDRLLDSFFQHPLLDEKEINKRSSIFQYFQIKELDFPFKEEEISQVENYLGAASGGSLLAMGLNAIQKKALNLIGLNTAYSQLQNGIKETVRLINKAHLYLSKLEKEDVKNPFQEQIKMVNALVGDKKFLWLTTPIEQDLSTFKLTQYDYLLRQVFHQQVKQVLHVLYQIDVNIAVSTVARDRNFSYATVLPKGDNLIQMEEVWHPWLKKPISNSITIDRHKNVIFLTGANMAGKSTFMKSFGIAVYLSHMGFPIAAKHMSISIQDGMYTSINVPDNLNAGYSHFYAEVLRVKKVAEEVARGKNLVVIFDELFKGTNVKDALDATVAVTEAFSELRNCSYIISTHIIEAADALKRLSNFHFVFLPTKMQGTVPVYTYKLEDGVTADRHGKMIIDNEGIIQIILGKAPVVMW